MPRWLKGMLLSMGALFILTGVIVGVFGARAAQRHDDYLASLHPLSAATLREQPAGSDVIVEGVISPENPVVFRNYVAYRRDEYRVRTDNNGKRTQEWISSGSDKPRLILDAGGTVAITAERYSIMGGHELWDDPVTLDFQERPRDGTKRYYGLIAGKTATVFGTISQGPNGRELTAQTLFGGTREEFLAASRAATAMLPVLGGVFGAIGTILAAVGVIGILRW